MRRQDSGALSLGLGADAGVNELEKADSGQVVGPTSLVPCAPQLIRSNRSVMAQ